MNIGRGMDLVTALEVQRAPNWKKLLVKWFGLFVPMGERQRLGWSGKLPFYLFSCPFCGIAGEDYPHGFPGNRYLNCPECWAKIEFIGLLDIGEWLKVFCCIFRWRFSR